MTGARPGLDPAFDVSVRGLRGPLHDVTDEYAPPTRVVERARRRWLTSLDAPRVERRRRVGHRVDTARPSAVRVGRVRPWTNGGPAR